MIGVSKVRLYCKGDIFRIENYEKAVADTETMWDCHHRDEIRKLPSGMIALRSVDDLIEAGLYYQVPPEYLIFLPHSDHLSLHKRLKTYKRTGIPHTESTKELMRQKAKGHTLSGASKEKLRQWHLGRKLSEETRKRMSETHKKRMRQVKGDL